MEQIGISLDEFPFATANDGISRQEIVLKAMDRAKNLLGISEFKKTLYVGDGIWDAKTCKILNIPFIGISSQFPQERLILEGAIQVFPHFNEDFLKFLELND